jgi:sugar phosphate isomerase/epimerase
MKLRVFQALWGMQGLPYRSATPWSLDQQIAEIARAGFDGVEVAWTPTLPTGPKAIARAAEAGLSYSVLCFPRTVDEFKGIAEQFAGSGIQHINLQPNVKLTTPVEGVPYILGWLEVAHDAGLTVYFETHRDRMTTSLRYTLSLLAAVPSMRLVADLSHYVVGEEFAWPVPPDDDALIRQILGRASAFHGRVASREQIQLPISFSYHRPWVDLFAEWWEVGFDLWRQQAGPRDELVFVTELGPPMWYAITGADGQELSDRWQEALTLKELAGATWRKLEVGNTGAQ